MYFRFTIIFGMFRIDDIQKVSIQRVGMLMTTFSNYTNHQKATFGYVSRNEILYTSA